MHNHKMDLPSIAKQATHILCFKKLNTPGIVLSAARHNKRTIQAEQGADNHINAIKSYLNYSLAGPQSPDHIATKAKTLMEAAGYTKIRKDAVLAIEIVFSLPPARHEIDTKPFFADCLAWTENHFGGVVLSFDVHQDEAAPHAHALILPLINDRMQGSDLVGNKTRLRALQDSFHLHVGKYHCLIKPTRKLTGNRKTQTAKAVLDQLKNDSAMRSEIWTCIKNAIISAPDSYATSLGIKPPPPLSKIERSYVDIMTSKGRGKQSNPIEL